MEIIEVTAEEFGKIVGDNIPVFSKPKFLELNKNKVDRLHYLVGKDKKIRVALAIGEKNNEWCAPFSAPFSNIVILRKDTPIEYIWEFVNVLVEYIRNLGGKLINFYLPADIYGFEDNARIINALLGNGFKIDFQDINYSVDLNSFELEEYKSILPCNARRNLKIALGSSLEIIRCETDAQKEEAYDVIKQNREYRGFPLRMTKQQVMDTIKVVDHDLFLVKHEDQNIASAVVYRVTKKAAQVIYWGDIANVGEYKSMNFMACSLIEYYKKLKFEILDIGPSTEEGKPNFGLCVFKESIGCIPSAKYRLQINLGC